MSGQQVRVGEELKNFLNTNQYSRKSILRYEKIFGKTFVSTGGVNTTNDLCQKMDLKVININLQIIFFHCTCKKSYYPGGSEDSRRR